MALYCTLFLFFALGRTIGVCADGDPMMQDVLRKLSDLTSVVHQQNEKIVQLQQTVKTQGEEIETLKSIKAESHEELEALKSIKAESHEKIKGDRTPGSNKSESMALTTAPPSKLNHREPVKKSSTTEDKDSAGHLTPRVQRLLMGGSVAQRVGFTAYRYSNDPLILKQTLIYDKVLSNVGSRYSHHTGIFSADVSGLYVFYTGIECSPHQSMEIEIMNDGTSIGQTYCDSKSDAYGNSGEMVVAEVTSGSSIWVRVGSTSNPNADIIGHKTMFSGFLLN